ncbi:MAG: NAD(P)-binding domain-containing protein [Actinomycetota bacterium]|nr:NAD(P)-binding domain-containing protein [Actinomycetota bacterium]
MTSANRRVCVIGAGSSGIASCQVLDARGIDFDCYEQGSNVGGNWRYGNDNGMSSAYESLFINTSRDVMEYATYPMPKSYPDYPHHSQIAAYFDDYVDHFGLREKIAFRTEVTRVEQALEGGWDVTVRPADGGDERTTRYDDVLVANGHHWDPRWPEPPFPGELDDSVDVVHAHYYRTSEGYEDKNVLVLGIGNSACDIAVETSRVSKMTYLAMRRGAWIVPKYIGSKPVDEISPGWIATYVPFWIQRLFMQMTIKRVQGDPTQFGLPKPDHRIMEAHPTVSSDLLPRIGHGRITVKPNVARLEGDSVRFVDGSVEKIDKVIYCTGYKISFPFIDPDLLDPSGDNRIELYRRVVAPDLPGLYFIGLVQPLGAIMPIAELQSEWIADVIEGKVTLPLRGEMVTEIAAEQAAMRKRYVASKRHTIQVDYWPYLHQLREERKRRALAPQTGTPAGRAAKEEIAA